jgi:hypothetical protein
MKEISFLDERIKLQRRKTFCCVFMDSSKKENIKRFHSEPYRQRNFHTLATCMLNNSLDKKLCSAETLRQALLGLVSLIYDGLLDCLFSFIVFMKRENVIF